MAKIKFDPKSGSNQGGIKINWKDVAGKAGQNAATLFAPVMPTTVGTAINTTQTLRDIRRAKRSQRVSQRAMQDRSAQEVKKSMAVLNSAFRDIDSGNYNLDKANRELYDDYEDQTASEFDMPKGDDASEMSSEEILLAGNRGVAKSIVQSGSAQLRGMQGAAAALINANIKTSRAIIDSTTATMQAGFNAINTSIVITNQRLETVNNSLQSILAFHNQNTIQFYQTAIQMMNGMGQMMDNLQTTLAPTERDKGRRFDVRNGFSPRAFIDYIKQGAQESAMGVLFGAAAGNDGTRVNPSLKNLLRNDGRGFAGMGGVMGMVLNKVIPKSIENTLGSFDKQMQTLMETGLARLGETLGKIPGLGLDNIVGNKRENLNGIRMGRYMKDQLPWNGMAQKALVEVIPEYLANLDNNMEMLTRELVSPKALKAGKGNKRYYDYAGGQFMTQKELKKQFESEFMDRINLAMKESMDSLQQVIAGSGKTEKEQEKAIAAIERLIDQRITKASSGPEAQQNWRDMTSVLQSFGIGKDEGLAVINQITAGVSEAISQLNDLTHEVETTQNVYRNLNLNRHQEGHGQMRARIERSATGQGEAIRYRGFSKIPSVEKFIKQAESGMSSIPGAENYLAVNGSLAKDKDLQSTVISGLYSGMSEKDLAAEVLRQHAIRYAKLERLTDPNYVQGGGNALGRLIRRGQVTAARMQDRIDRAGAVINPHLENATRQITSRADRLINGRSAWDDASLSDDDGSVGNGRGPIGYGPAEMGRFAARNGYISQGGANAKLFTEGAARLGMTANPVTNTRQLKSALSSGKPVILGGKSSGYGSPYTKAGHVVAADAIQGNKARVLDPISGRKSYYDINALGAGATHAWSYDKAVGYGRRNKKRASSRASKKSQVPQSSEVDLKGVAGIEKKAMLGLEDGMNRSQPEIDADMNVTNKLLQRMRDEPPAQSVEQSIIQSNNMVRAAFGNVIANLNAGMAKVFGKEGFFAKLWNSDARKEITGKLFTNEDAIFGDQYRWAKEKLGNLKRSVGSEVAKGYDFLYDNTMQYLYGKDEEGNDIHYSQNEKWQNNKFVNQTVNRRYRADQRAIRKAKREAEKNGTELPPELADSVRTYSYGDLEDDDSTKIVRSTFDTATNQWKSFTSAQWRKLHPDDEKKDKESKDAESAAGDLKTKVGDFAKDLQAGASEASKKLAETTSQLIHSNQLTASVADTLAGAAGDAAEVISEQTEKLKDDLKAVRETVTGSASEDDQKKSAAFKKSFIDKMKAAMPKALVAAGAGAALGTANLMSTSLLGAMFLPGGPVAGAIFGGALSLLSQTEAFKTFMFGKQDPETQKREGGLISSKLQEGFKKAAPYVVGGAVLGGLRGLAKSALGFGGGLGVMGIQLLPGGILGGALMGAGLGLLKNSESFKKMLFGEKGEDGKRSGKFLSDSWNNAKKAFANAMPKLGKAAAGAGAGALTGAVLANAGMLPAMLSFGGPVGMGIMGLGLGIASSTSKFNEWMFGSEMLDENGNPTGKRYKDGMLSRVQNLLMVNVIEPIGTSFKNNMLELVDWTKDKITYPFRLAFGPILDSFTNLKDSVVEFVHDTFERIGNGIMDAFKGAIKTVFSPITKIVGFLGKNFSGLVTGGIKLALTPLSIGLGGLSAITSPKRGKEYAKFYKEYYTSGLGNKLKDYWASAEKDGQKRTLGEKFNDIIQTYTGGGVIGDEFYDTYNKKMEENGQGNLGWRRVNRERKDLRTQRKERRKEAKRWEKIDAERRRIINKDLSGREVELTDAKVKDYRRTFKRLGISEDRLQSSEDIMNLLYRRNDFKDSLDPNKKAAQGTGTGETPEQKKAREETTQYQANMQEFMTRLNEHTAQIADIILKEKGINQEQKDWQRRKKRLKRRMKRAGVKINLKDPNLRYWDTDRLNRDTLDDFKLSGEKDIYKFMYKKGIGHADNAETALQIQELLGPDFSPDDINEDIPDVEGQPAPPPAPKSAKRPKPKRKRFKSITNGLLSKILKKKPDQPVDNDESVGNGIGYGDPFFTHTPIGFGDGDEGSSAAVTLLARISNSISALLKTSKEQKDIQSAQLEASTQGEISGSEVTKKKGKRFGSRIMKKFNDFTSWLGFNKKQKEADREAAESAAARSGTAAEEEDNELNVNVTTEGQKEEKKGLLGKIWDGIKGIGGFIGKSKVGSFLLKGIKTAGVIGLLGTVGFTIAELVRPGTSEKVGQQIDKFSQYINSPDFSMTKMFTDVKDIVVTKAKELGGWFSDTAYPWLIEHTGPVGEFFDNKVMPWLSNTGEKVGGWWDDIAWPFLKELPGKLLDGFVTVTGFVGDFIVNNGEKIVSATATVVENIIEPMGKLVVDLFCGIGKGLWAYIQKKFNPFYKDADDDITQAEEMINGYMGKNTNHEVIGNAKTEEEAKKIMEDAGYKNSSIEQKADGTFDVINRRVLGKRTAVDDENNTTTVANGNVLSTIFKQGINLLNPATRTATVEGLKLGGKLGMAGVKGGLSAAEMVGKTFGKIPVVGNFFKAGGGLAKLGKGAIDFGEKAVSNASGFFSSIAQKFGAKAVKEGTEEAAEAVVTEIADEVVEKGTKTVAKETAEKGVMATIKEILKKAVEATEKVATNGLLEKALSSLGKDQSPGIMKKIATKLVEVLNNLTKAPAKFANKILETLQGSLAKATGETAAGAGTAGISIAVMATVSGVMGAIDAPNLFGVKAEDCTGGMRIVSAVFEALLSIPWVGTFLEAAMLIMSFAFNTNLKQELATFFYELVCAGDQEKIRNLEVSRDQMDLERQVYNKLHGTNLSTDAYNDLANTTTVGHMLNGGKSAVNFVSNLFTGKDAFAVADSNKDSVNITKALQDKGYTTDQILSMDADQMKAAAGYGPGITLKSIASRITGQANSVMQKSLSLVKSAMPMFDRTQGVNQSALNQIGLASQGNQSISIVASIDAKLSSVVELLTALVSGGSTNSGGKGMKDILTGAFNSALSVIASSGLIKSTNISELRQNLSSIVSNSNTLTALKNTLKKLNPFAAQTMGYGDSDMYKQGNSSWADMPIGTFPNGQTATMKEAGCGPTALAAVANQLMGYGPVSPAQMGAYAAANGYISQGGANAGLFTEGAARMGLKSTPLTNATGVKASLMSGKPVVMTGTSASSSDPYTKAGHIVVADGIQGNNARVLDPVTGKRRLYNLNSIAKKTEHAWSYDRPMGYGPRPSEKLAVGLTPGKSSNVTKPSTTTTKSTTTRTSTTITGRYSVNNPFLTSPLAGVNTLTTSYSGGSSDPENIKTTVNGKESTYSVDLFGTMSVSEIGYDATKHFKRNTDASGIDSLAMDKNYEYFKNKTNNFAKASGNYKNCANYTLGYVGNDKKVFTRTGLHWLLNTQFFGLTGGTYGNVTIANRTQGPRGNAVSPSTVGKAERLRILAAGAISKMINGTRGPVKVVPLSQAEKVAIMCNGLRVICGSYALATYLSTRSNFTKMLSDISDEEIETAYNSAIGKVNTDGIENAVNGDGTIDDAAVNEMAATPASTKGLFSQEELATYRKWLDSKDSGKGFFGKSVSTFALLGKIIKAKINSILNGTDFYEELAAITTEETDKMYGVTSDDAGENNAVAINYTSDGGTTVNIAGNNTKEKIWNYLRGSGLTPYAASGVMGCWEAESSNNPETLEGYYLTKTPTKDIIATSASLDKFTTGTLFPAYARSNISINKKAYKGKNGHYYPGLGLAQWTGPRGYNLFEFSKNNKYNWGEVGPQLRFYQSEFDARTGLKQKMNSATSPADAAAKFFDGFEMYNGYAAEHPKALKKRSDPAKSYYDMYRNLTADTVGMGPGPGRTDVSNEELRRLEKSEKYKNRTSGRANPIGFGPEDGTTPAEGETSIKPSAAVTMQQYREGMNTVSTTIADYFLKQTGMNISDLMSSSADSGDTTSTTGSVDGGITFTANDGISAADPNGKWKLDNEVLTSLSGTDRDRYLAAAQSQVGYLEKKDTSAGRKSFTANPGGGSVNKFTKEMINGDNHWCACFAAWCARAANIPNNIIWQERSSAGCTNVLAHARKLGIFHARGTYTPQPGDQILFWKNNVSNPETWKDSSHIGIVEKCDGTSVYTIEGNASNSCKRCTYKLTNGKIIGYVHPQWAGDNRSVVPTDYLTLGYGPETDNTMSTTPKMSFGDQMRLLTSKVGEVFSKMGLPTSSSGGSTGTNDEISVTDSGITGDSSIITGANSEETIWKTLRNAGFSAAGAAGIMGNLYAESGLRSNNLQNSYEKKLGYSDDSYTSAVDSGRYNNFIKDKAGYGLAQWTYWSRKQNLLNYAKSMGKSIGDPGMQTSFLLKELGDYGLLDKLKSATSVKDASNVMMLKFEKPANQSVANQNKRASYGQGYYDKYASLGFGPGPSTIQVESPATREMHRTRLLEGKPYTVDPKEFKALGLGDGMKVDAGFDMTSTDGRLDRIAGLMAEWMAQSQSGKATGAPTQQETNTNTIKSITNNNTVIAAGGRPLPVDSVKTERYKPTMLKQHRILSGRVNARPRLDRK